MVPRSAQKLRLIKIFICPNSKDHAIIPQNQKRYHHTNQTNTLNKATSCNKCKQVKQHELQKLEDVLGGTGVFCGQWTLLCLFSIICLFVIMSIWNFFICVLLQSFGFGFHFYVYFRVWHHGRKEPGLPSASTSVLNHGHDRKPEGEPSFIINDLLSSTMYFLWLSVFIISSLGWSLSPVRGGVMKAAAGVLGGALLLRMKNALREYILY